jgi:hypothetical protein
VRPPYPTWGGRARVRRLCYRRKERSTGRRASDRTSLAHTPVDWHRFAADRPRRPTWPSRPATFADLRPDRLVMPHSPPGRRPSRRLLGATDSNRFARPGEGLTCRPASLYTVEGSNDCKSAGIAFGGSNPPRPTNQCGPRSHGRAVTSSTERAHVSPRGCRNRKCATESVDCWHISLPRSVQ